MLNKMPIMKHISSVILHPNKMWPDKVEILAVKQDYRFAGMLPRSEFIIMRSNFKQSKLIYLLRKNIA